MLYMTVNRYIDQSQKSWNWKLCYSNLLSTFGWLSFGILCKVDFRYMLLLKSLREAIKYYKCNHIIFIYNLLEDYIKW